ncbi:CASP-like protein 4D1 [Corylus avellana]|uniref:CASP-like protein 4D1 n=1 Tax=Corylus avellana TaxID=13451 RepID=UPI00286ADFB6|nr:CASP-like protein 4D1 [Corylus avellana]
MKKNRGIAISSLVLRILTLAKLLSCIGLFVTDKITLGLDGDSKVTIFSFKDVIAYRYAVAIAAIGAVYTLLQLPFAIYYAIKGKRLNGCFPEFDFYGDKLISLLLATAVGAGFAISVEFKRNVDNLADDFLDKAIIATGVLLGGNCLHGCSFSTFIHQSKQQVEDCLD